MIRLLLVVEGQTERALIQQALAPYLGEKGLAVHPKVVGNPGHKGGIRSFDSVSREILTLLKQEPDSLVGTFFDYYGLPTAWPGRDKSLNQPKDQVGGVIELSMQEAISSKLDTSARPNRFIPYVQMYELEALLFADPKIMAAVFENPALEASFAEIVDKCEGCEKINDDVSTAPSKRIEGIFQNYRKGSGIRAQAPIIAKRIGIDRIRGACPRFHQWLNKLEELAIRAQL